MLPSLEYLKTFFECKTLVVINLLLIFFKKILKEQKIMYLKRNFEQRILTLF